jgi:hypothetical protein
LVTLAKIARQRCICCFAAFYPNLLGMDPLKQVIR